MNDDGARITRILRSTAALAAALTACSLPAGAVMAQDRDQRAQELLSAENPLEPSDSVWIEELTYLEVRDRIEAGHTVAIIPTGGVEQNGPYLATGKHNVILEAHELGHRQ